MAKEIGSLAINLLANTATFTKQMDRASRKMDSFGQKVSNAAKLAAGAIAGIGAARLVGDVIKSADTMSLLESKIRLVSASNAEAATRQQAVFAAAQRTRSEFESTVTLYTRMVRATNELNLSQAKQLELTETINKAVKVSGATNTEATAAIIQLSQGLAAGVLRGEELNSVMEQTPRLAQAIAQGMGITIGQLREFGKSGKLTAETVVKAISSQSDVIHREFTKVPLTVEQASTKFKNSLLAMAGSFKPLNEMLAKALSGLSALADKISGMESKETRFNELFARRQKLLDEQNRGWGIYYGLNSNGRKREIDDITRKLALLQNERVEEQKLAATIEAKNAAAKPAKTVVDGDAEKERIRNLSHIEGLILQNQSAQEAASDSLYRYNALWQAGLISVEAYTQKVRESSKAFEPVIANAEKQQKELTRIEQQESERRKWIAEQEAKHKVRTAASVTGSIASILNSLAQMNEGASRKQFERQKKLQRGSVIASTAAGIMRAYADLGPIAGTAAAIAIAAAGAAQLVAINRTQFNSGGGGITSPTGPTIPTNNNNTTTNNTTNQSTVNNFFVVGDSNAVEQVQAFINKGGRLLEENSADTLYILEQAQQAL